MFFYYQLFLAEWNASDSSTDTYFHVALYDCNYDVYNIPSSMLLTNVCLFFYFRVFANDLNPNSYDWLKHNFELNKVPKEQFFCCNKDGKDFIKEVT